MAGFDFEFSFNRDHEPYVEACIRVCKGRARALGCRWRVRRLGLQDRRRCTVDGNTRRLDILGRALEHDLPTVCEGVTGRLSPSRARALGLGFADLYLLGRDTTLGEELLVLRPKSATSLYYPVYSFTDTTRASPRLGARLRITEDVLSDYGLARYESVVVLEELHTALEQTLRELLPSVDKRSRWPELLGAARDAGLLGRLTWAAPHEHLDSELLRDMTRRRNAAKHRDGDPNDDWLHEHWECISLVLERLVSAL